MKRTWAQIPKHFDVSDVKKTHFKLTYWRGKTSNRRKTSNCTLHFATVGHKTDTFYQNSVLKMTHSEGLSCYTEKEWFSKIKFIVEITVRN